MNYTINENTEEENGRRSSFDFKSIDSIRIQRQLLRQMVNGNNPQRDSTPYCACLLLFSIFIFENI